MSKAKQRTNVPVVDLPKWFTDDRKFGLYHLGSWWLTNGHAMIRVDKDPVSKPLKDGWEGAVNQWFSAPRSAAVPSGAYLAKGTLASVEWGESGPGSEVSDYAVDLGPARMSLAYVALVEHLFPGCQWTAIGVQEPAFATVGDEVVAVVMSCREPARSPS